ncbi:MAG: transglutaminase-like domain-containing protein [Gammaproteobacteria bacterium]|nr:transglutaminase-like domain-containing protein [Gammaproteobacteria bacterium]
MITPFPSTHSGYGNFERKGKWTRTTAKLILLPFLWSTSGAATLAQIEAAKANPAAAMERLAADPRVHVPEAVLAQARTIDARAAAPNRPIHRERQAVIDMHAVGFELRSLLGSLETGDADIDTARLAALKVKLEAAHADIESGFVRFETVLENYKLSEEILQRQQTHRARYQQSWNTLQSHLAVAESATTAAQRAAALDSAAAMLATSHDRRPIQPFDAHNLPFAVADPEARVPRSEWDSPGVDAPDSAVLPVGGNRATATNSVTDSIGLLAEPPEPEFLEANEDVQITQEIQVLAASLGNNPVQIYEWVRNNIDFHPTYGSLQGSQLTLEMRRGNSADISSLLVALLRAAGIAARYVVGTINLQAGDVLNWLGDVQDAVLAQQILGSGAIPNVAIVAGSGEILSFDIEHVWVEAFVDMIPSRGALNIEGDSWVEMDAAVKRYAVTAPSNLVGDLPLDPVLTDIRNSLTIDESLGQFSDIDEQATVSSLESWVEDALEYMVVNDIEQTPTAIMGEKTIVPETITRLPGTVPFTIKSSAAPVATLPASLRQTIEVVGYSSSFDRTLGFADFSATVSFAALGSGRLGLTFPPATEADAAVLQAARDAGAGSLPIASVNVMPQVTLDDTVEVSGSTLGMGEDYFLEVTIAGPIVTNRQQYDVIAGDEIVLGVTGNGFLPDVLQSRLDTNPVDTSAEYLHQVNLHYWTESDFLNQQSAHGLGGFITRLPSAGLFSSPLTVTYLFGQPNTGVYASKFMDVKWSFVGAAATSDEMRVALVKQAGFNGSYMEGTTFDQFETVTTGTPRILAVDSMKLLSAANAQGIPLYRITPANQGVVFPLLNLDPGDESNIASALAAGQTVLAPQRNIDIGPWSGAGYIMQDESTGAGAYLISGGINGGGLADCLEELVRKIITVLAIIALAIIAIILLYYLIAAVAAALAAALAGTAAAAEAWAGFLLMMRALAVLAV